MNESRGPENEGTLRAAGGSDLPVPQPPAIEPDGWSWLRESQVLQGPNLKDQVVSTLKAAITFGSIRGGDVVSVPQLAERLAVSRTPVREALLELAVHGIVQPLRNRGYLVYRPTRSELTEILTARRAIEGPAHALVIGRISDEDFEHAQGLVDELEGCIDAHDAARFILLDRELHLFLLERGNSVLARTIGELRGRATFRPPAELLQFLPEANRQHSDLLQAIKDGNEDLVSKVAGEHMQGLIDSWVAWPDEPSQTQS